MNESRLPEETLTSLGRQYLGEPGAYLGKIVAKSGKQILNDLVFGHGDYTIKTNSITGTDAVPMFGGNGTRVKNKEFIKDISSSATAGLFKLERFRINPADSNTFPWLSEVAEQFSEYRLHGLMFEYKTTSADALNSTNTALGTVVMATQYNAYEEPFNNKQFMENSTYACSTKPSCNLIHGIECARFENPQEVMYTAAGTPSEGDLRMYDLGTFSIATVGLQGTSVTVGELWVTYDCEFLKPREITSPDLISHFGNQVGVAGATPFGTQANLATDTIRNDFGITISCTNRTITWPKSYSGLSQVSIQWSGTAATVVSPVFTASGGAANYPCLYDGTNGEDETIAAAGTSQTCSVCKYYQITQGGVVTLGAAGTLPGGANAVVDITVQTVPANYGLIGL